MQKQRLVHFPAFPPHARNIPTLRRVPWPTFRWWRWGLASKNRPVSCTTGIPSFLPGAMGRHTNYETLKVLVRYIQGIFRSKGQSAVSDFLGLVCESLIKHGLETPMPSHAINVLFKGVVDTARMLPYFKTTCRRWTVSRFPCSVHFGPPRKVLIKGSIYRDARTVTWASPSNLFSLTSFHSLWTLIYLSFTLPTGISFGVKWRSGDLSRHQGRITFWRNEAQRWLSIKAVALKSQ